MSSIKIINSPNAPSPVGPYNHSVLYQGVLYGSGQIAIDPSSGDLITDNISDETDQVMRNIGAVLKSAGLDYSHILKCTIFVKDMHQYASINQVYSKYFDDASAPARELVEVANLPKFVNIEISFLAGVN